MITTQDMAAYREQGYLVCRGLLDVAQDIHPLRQDIQRLVREVAAGHGVAMAEPSNAAEAFDADYLALTASRPDLHPIIYDSVKLLLPFVRLTTHPRIVEAFKGLHETDFVGWPASGVGIRIDRAGEVKHLLPWHQDFPYQLRSTRSATFWIPLVPVPAALGPVAVCEGSHMLGPLPLVPEAEGTDEQVSRGVYDALQVEDCDTHVTRHRELAPELEPGDVLAFDSCTLHRSGLNISNATRWSCQVRLFSFSDEFGRETGWKGSFKTGKTLEDVNRDVAQAAATRR